MARPEKPINWELVDKFLESGCTQKQIANSIGVDVNTLHDRFIKQYGCSYTDYSDRKCQYGEALLLAAQMKKALAGNTQMLIWLGKVRLGQREPESLINIPPNDKDLDEKFALLKENKQLKDELDAFKYKANSELPRS
jgi:hypothetical protein